VTLTNDKRNRFERIYTKKFEEIAAAYGIGIDYEEDRAALDFGLHLTIPGATFEGVTATRVWFQFKGQSTATLTIAKFDKKDDISQQVEIEHLRQWYRYAEPVYLVVYLECVDKFFAVDIKEVIDELWGDSVFKDETFMKPGEEERQDKVTIRIPKTAEISDVFWQRLGLHSSMRTDGASYQGNPLPHNYDFNSRVPQVMEPALFTEVVEALLNAHRYRVKAEHDALQLYPESGRDGDLATLTTGIMYDPYEVVLYLTSELVPDQDGFRAEGQTFKVQGKTAVLIHSNVKSRPDVQMLSELRQELEEQGIEHFMVFVNHFMMFNEGLTGVKSHNARPKFVEAFAKGRVSLVVQHLEDLGRQILLATKVYVAYRERIPWVDETVSQRLKAGELHILD